MTQHDTLIGAGKIRVRSKVLKVIQFTELGYEGLACRCHRALLVTRFTDFPSLPLFSTATLSDCGSTMNEVGRARTFLVQKGLSVSIWRYHTYYSTVRL